MAGKTLIDGTAYSIKGGKTLIDGTAYSIKQGKTLIDGTAYTISFGKTVSISGSTITSSGTYYAYAAIQGMAKNDGTYTIDDDTQLSVRLAGTESAYSQYCRVYLNDTLVHSGSTAYQIDTSSYTNINIEFKAQNFSTYYWCYITAT